MFGKRKHRADEEEQSLVPHGLVWQAMAETEPAEEPKDEVEPATPPATTHQIVAPPVQLSEGESAAVPPAEKTHGSSLFWRRVVSPETVKPAAPAASSIILLQRPALDVATENGSDQYSSSTAYPAERKVKPAKAAERLFTHVARRLSARRKQAARILDLRKFIGVIGHRGVAVITGARAKMRMARQLPGLRRHAAGASAFVAARARIAGSTVRHGYEQLKARGKVRLVSSASFTSVQSGSDVNTAVPPATKPHPRSISRRYGAVRIRLVGLPAQVRVALARWLSARKMKFHTLRYDSRLWTSVAMAGLSALLAFGLILTVRRYATAALPSHVFQKDSSPPVCTPAAAASVVPPKPAPAVQSARLSNKAVAIPPKRMNTARVVQPKSRHSLEDEYVARDTYVYYGKRQSASR